MAFVPTTPLPMTGNLRVDSVLLDGYYWAGGTNGGRTIITINFVGTSLSEPEATFGYEDDAFFAGMLAWERVANIDLVHVAQSINADIRVLTGTWFQEPIFWADGSISDSLAYSETPGIALLKFQEGRPRYEARSYFNTDGDGWDAAGLTRGGYGFWTVLHELGHALGLGHPFETVGHGATVSDGVFSVMAYDVGTFPSGFYTVLRGGFGLEFIKNTSGQDIKDYGYFNTPSAFDIAAIQYLYGANPTFRSGNDRYTLPSANNPQAPGTPATAWTTIWDTGGADTIEYTGSDDVRISLRPLDVDLGLNVNYANSLMSQARHIRGGFVIADDYADALTDIDGVTGVIIEDAVGGAGNDSILGNDTRNRLTGNAGADSILGAGGNDELFGDAGADSLAGNDGADTLTGGDDDDLLFGQDGHDSLDGGKHADQLRGGKGNDSLAGGEGADTLFGQADADLLEGGDGDDHLVGADAADTLTGGTGADRLWGGLDADWLDGSADNDVLAGGDEADTLLGGEGVDVLVGQDGDDVIVAGSDTDRDMLTGGAGADEFVFGPLIGRDVVVDFTPGEDILNFGGTAIVDFAGFSVRALDRGADLHVRVSPGNLVILRGVQEQELTAGDILFG